MDGYEFYAPTFLLNGKENHCSFPSFHFNCLRDIFLMPRFTTRAVLRDERGDAMQRYKSGSLIYDGGCIFEFAIRHLSARLWCGTSWLKFIPISCQNVCCRSFSHITSSQSHFQLTAVDALESSRISKHKRIPRTIPFRCHHSL